MKTAGAAAAAASTNARGEQMDVVGDGKKRTAPSATSASKRVEVDPERQGIDRDWLFHVLKFDDVDCKRVLPLFKKAGVSNVGKLRALANHITLQGLSFVAPEPIHNLSSFHLGIISDWAKRTKPMDESLSQQFSATYQLMSFDDAFNTVMNRCVWPESLDDFLPKPFVAPPSSPYAESVRNAGLMASFGDPSTPDFLLTALDTAFDFTNLQSIRSTDNGIEIIADGITEKANLNLFGVVAIIGTSGSGKTRLTLHLAWSDYAILYNFSTEGNGGSDDLKEILRRSATSYELLRNMFRANVMFRTKLLHWCQTKYGDGFKPAHRMMLQLYSRKIVKLDMFDAFSRLSVNVMAEKGLADADIFKWVVLDEAQAAEAIDGFFDMYHRPRSVLFPIIDILRSIFRYSPLVICGTKLPISDLTSSIRSPIKVGVGLTTLGLCTYFTPDDVIKVLEKWGVNDAENHRDSCVYIQGRPRFADYLARNVLINGGWQNEEDAFRMIELRLRTSWNKLAGSHQGTKNLGSYMREMAFEWLLGRPQRLIDGSELAIGLGIGTLDANVDGAVLREPMVIDSIFPDPLASFEKLLQDEHPTFGYDFEEYVVLSAQSIDAGPQEKYPVVVRDEVMKCDVLKVVIGKNEDTRPIGMRAGFEKLKRFKMKQ